LPTRFYFRSYPTPLVFLYLVSFNASAAGMDATEREELFVLNAAGWDNGQLN